MSENTVQKKTRGFRPNIIDFLIVVIVIGVVVGVALRMGVVDKVIKSSSVEEARISVLVKDINNDSYNYFNAGDEFYSATHNCYFGRLEEKPLDNAAEVYVVGIDGQMIATHSPSDPENPGQNARIDVRAKLIGSGVFSDEGFLLGGTTYIAPGSEVKLQSRNITVTVLVTNIEPLNAAE